MRSIKTGYVMFFLKSRFIYIAVSFLISVVALGCASSINLSELPSKEEAIQVAVRQRGTCKFFENGIQDATTLGQVYPYKRYTIRVLKVNYTDFYQPILFLDDNGAEIPEKSCSLFYSVTPDEIVRAMVALGVKYEE